MTSTIATFKREWLGPALCLALIFGLGACAQTTVSDEATYQGAGRLPPPSLVLVYDFAIAPNEVELDKGLAPRVGEALSGEPRTEQEMQAGQKVVEVISRRLVDDLKAKGLPAQQAFDIPPLEEGTLMIRGQLVSIDEGNRTERVVIGLGAGRTDVEAHVQIIELTDEGEKDVEQFNVAAKSGRKPGMAELTGVGAVAGHLLMSAGLSAAGSVASEAWGANIDADAKRLADKVSSEVLDFFNDHGWTKEGDSS